MKKIFKFFDLFLKKLTGEVFTILFFLLLFVFGIIVVTALWSHDLIGKIALIIAGIYLIGSSAVESYFKVTNEKLDKDLSEAIDRSKELHTELEKLMNKKKFQNMRWRFYEYLKEDANGKE